MEPYNGEMMELGGVVDPGLPGVLKGKESPQEKPWANKEQCKCSYDGMLAAPCPCSLRIC